MRTLGTRAVGREEDTGEGQGCSAGVRTLRTRTAERGDEDASGRMRMLGEAKDSHKG